MFNMQAWSNEFFQQPTQPMSKEMSEIFLRMMFMEQEQQKVKIPQIQSQFLYQIIDKRANYIGLELSEPAKIFLMFETKSPGTAVMYLYALRSKFTSVTMGNIADMFPMGFPTEPTLHKIWEKQKDPKGDNYLDSHQFADIKKQNKP